MSFILNLLLYPPSAQTFRNISSSSCIDECSSTNSLKYRKGIWGQKLIQIHDRKVRITTWLSWIKEKFQSLYNCSRNVIDHRSTTNDPLPENHVIKDISRGSFLVQYLINDQDLDDRGSRKVPLVQKLVQWIFRGKEISHESNKKTNNQSYNQFEENIFSDFFRNDSNLESHFSQ